MTAFPSTTLVLHHNDKTPVDQTMAARSQRSSPLKRQDVPITSAPADGHSYVLEFYPTGISKEKAVENSVPVSPSSKAMGN